MLHHARRSIAACRALHQCAAIPPAIASCSVSAMAAATCAAPCAASAHSSHSLPRAHGVSTTPRRSVRMFSTVVRHHDSTDADAMPMPPSGLSASHTAPSVAAAAELNAEADSAASSALSSAAEEPSQQQQRRSSPLLSGSLQRAVGQQLNSLARTGDWGAAEVLIADLVDGAGLAPQLSVVGAWLQCYEQSGEWKRAEAVWERMVSEWKLRPSGQTYATLMAIYHRDGQKAQMDKIEPLYLQSLAQGGKQGRLSAIHLCNLARAALRRDQKDWAHRWAMRARQLPKDEWRELSDTQKAFLLRLIATHTGTVNAGAGAHGQATSIAAAAVLANKSVTSLPSQALSTAAALARSRAAAAVARSVASARGVRRSDDDGDEAIDVSQEVRGGAEPTIGEQLVRCAAQGKLEEAEALGATLQSPRDLAAATAAPDVADRNRLHSSNSSSHDKGWSTFVFTAWLLNYVRGGHWSRAEKAWARMPELGLQPTPATFAAMVQIYLRGAGVAVASARASAADAGTASIHLRIARSLLAEKLPSLEDDMRTRRDKRGFPFQFSLNNVDRILRAAFAAIKDANSSRSSSKTTSGPVDTSAKHELESMLQAMSHPSVEESAPQTLSDDAQSDEASPDAPSTADTAAAAAAVVSSLERELCRWALHAREARMVGRLSNEGRRAIDEATILSGGIPPAADTTSAPSSSFSQSSNDVTSMSELSSFPSAATASSSSGSLSSDDDATSRMLLDLHSCSATGDWHRAEQILSAQGDELACTLPLFDAWLGCYERSGAWQRAEHLWSRLGELRLRPSARSYATLMTVYLSTRSQTHLDKIDALLDEMNAGGPPQLLVPASDPMAASASLPFVGGGGPLRFQAADYAMLLKACRRVRLGDQARAWAERARAQGYWHRLDAASHFIVASVDKWEDTSLKVRAKKEAGTGDDGTVSAYDDASLDMPPSASNDGADVGDGVTPLPPLPVLTTLREFNGWLERGSNWSRAEDVWSRLRVLGMRANADTVVTMLSVIMLSETRVDKEAKRPRGAKHGTQHNRNVDSKIERIWADVIRHAQAQGIGSGVPGERHHHHSHAVAQNNNNIRHLPLSRTASRLLPKHYAQLILTARSVGLGVQAERWARRAREAGVWALLPRAAQTTVRTIDRWTAATAATEEADSSDAHSAEATTADDDFDIADADDVGIAAPAAPTSEPSTAAPLAQSQTIAQLQQQMSEMAALMAKLHARTEEAEMRQQQQQRQQAAPSMPAAATTSAPAADATPAASAAPSEPSDSAAAPVAAAKEPRSNEPSSPSSSSSPAADAEADALRKLTVVELKARLSARGLKVSGVKAVLIERLLAAHV